MQGKNLESGRTLAEMIGTFFVMGVLTIAFIFTYIQVLEYYNTNKTLEQIQRLKNNIKELYILKRAYTGLSIPLLMELKQLPDTIELDETKTFAVNAYKGIIQIGTAGHNAGYFYITYTDLTQKACSKIASKKWDEDLVNLQIGNEGFTGPFPLAVDIVTHACQGKQTVRLLFK